MSGNERQLSAVSGSMKNDSNGVLFARLPLLATACLSDSRLHMKKLGCHDVKTRDCKDRTCVCKTSVAIIIRLSTRRTSDSDNWHIHLVD